MRRTGRRAAAIVSLAAGLLAGACAVPPSNDNRAPAEPPRASDAGSDRSPRSRLVRDAFRDEPWVYDGRPGRMVATPHYQIFLTQTEPGFVGRVPAFLEAAFGHYRVVATGEARPLAEPESSRPLTSYIFRTRAEWERMTRQLLGENAGPFLRIERGGYAWGGIAVLFDLDAGRGASRDTLSLVAHEGWHQFTQATFKQPLPPWLEEGVATLCEGYSWTGGDAVAVFAPANNPERRAQLARLVAAGKLRSVQSLVLDLPADLAAGRSGDALDYYAQVWALALFLKEEPHYAAALASCVEDARDGRLGARTVEVLGPDRSAALLRSGSGGRSLAVLEACFRSLPGGLDSLEAGYRSFATELAQRNADR